MHTSRPFERTPRRTSESAAVLTARRRARLRARLCPVSLLCADLGAFVVATFLAFAVSVASDTSPYHRAIDNVTTLGAGWHGWGSLLVLVSLLSYFGGRGHYTSRVPSWTQLGDVVIATIVALACDIFLTVAVYDRRCCWKAAALDPLLPMPAAAARRGATDAARLGVVDAANADRGGPGARWRRPRRRSVRILRWATAWSVGTPATPRRSPTMNCLACWRDAAPISW